MAEKPCPHVTPAMIAAGFTQCGVCENGAPPAGFDKEDTSRQEAAVEAARDGLGCALRDLEAECHRAAKAAYSKRGQPDMPKVWQTVNAVRRAEEAVDTAVYDLQTAKGADG